QPDDDVPELNEHSSISDYSPWLQGNEDTPANIQGVYVKVIGSSSAMTTAIVWIESMAPEEVHHNKHEKFLILEGSCTIAVENELMNFNPGDFFEIPLHKKHSVTVTSSIPCKVILQRVAA
ncbi:MAG: cupin domain-containing protein, partial [Ginsengibacter sp.]